MTHKPKRPRLARTLKVAGGLLAGFAIIGWVALWVLSPFTLSAPRPGGPHIIGFQTRVIVDQTRSTSINGRIGPRPVTLEIWYPATSTEDLNREPSLSPLLIEMQQTYLGIPAALNDSTPSNAFRNAPPLRGRHPVIVFNHGYGSFTRQNLSDVERLASQGYVVIAIGHPGESLVAQEASGNREIGFDGDNPGWQRIAALQRENAAGLASAIAEALRAQRQADSDDTFRAAAKKLGMSEPYASIRPTLYSWIADTRLLLTHVPSIPFADASRVVLMGHSAGGAVALALARDPSPGVLGVINLDAPLLSYGDDVLRPARVPVLALLSTQNLTAGHNLSMSGTFDRWLAAAPSGSHVVEIAGISHFNFPDLNYLVILKRFSMLGNIDAMRMGQLQAQAIDTFVARLTDPSANTGNGPLLPASPDVSQRSW
jgi:dienelactone hydrolase